jgi:hypothetical protein
MNTRINLENKRTSEIRFWRLIRIAIVNISGEMQCEDFS